MTIVTFLVRLSQVQRGPASGHAYIQIHPNLRFELPLPCLDPGSIVPFGDLDGTVAEQLRDAVERHALQEQRHRKGIAEAMRMTVVHLRVGGHADLLHTEVAALRASLDSMHVETADIVGMSHGGVTALVFALESSRRVLTLTLIEPPAFWVLPNHGHDDPGANEMQALVSSLRHVTITEAHLERFRCLLGDCVNGRSPRHAPQWNQWVKYRNSLRGLHTIGDYEDDPGRLRGLMVCTLVVNGADTVAFHRAINAELVRLLPRAEALELAGGHNSTASAPDYLVAEWRKFQQRASNATGRRDP